MPLQTYTIIRCCYTQVLQSDTVWRKEWNHGSLRNNLGIATPDRCNYPRFADQGGLFLIVHRYFGRRVYVCRLQLGGNDRAHYFGHQLPSRWQRRNHSLFDLLGHNRLAYASVRLFKSLWKLGGKGHQDQKVLAYFYILAGSVFLYWRLFQFADHRKYYAPHYRQAQGKPRKIGI